MKRRLEGKALDKGELKVECSVLAAWEKEWQNTSLLANMKLDMKA